MQSLYHDSQVTGKKEGAVNYMMHRSQQFKTNQVRGSRMAISRTEIWKEALLDAAQHHYHLGNNDFGGPPFLFIYLHCWRAPFSPIGHYLLMLAKAVIAKNTIQ